MSLPVIKVVVLRQEPRCWAAIARVDPANPDNDCVGISDSQSGAIDRAKIAAISVYGDELAHVDWQIVGEIA